MDIKDIYRIYLQHPEITTDSRNCPEGSIFLALKGTSFDGNKFAAKALEQGCSYAIVDEPEYVDSTDERIIVVNDALTTYKELARAHRREPTARPQPRNLYLPFWPKSFAFCTPKPTTTTTSACPAPCFG